MKKDFGFIRTVLVWVVVIFLITIMLLTAIAVTSLNRHDRSFFGYKMFIVASDSMEATDFKSGDLIFVKKVAPETLKTGDIITFISKDTYSYGETLTHKIRVATTDLAGNPGFITYGTTTNTDDQTLVSYDAIIGKYVHRVSGLGTILNFLKSPVGFFLFIFIPILAIIIYEIINILRLIRKSKKMTLQEEVDTEKLKLEEELRVLKARLDRQELALKKQIYALRFSGPIKKNYRVKRATLKLTRRKGYRR